MDTSHTMNARNIKLFIFYFFIYIVNRAALYLRSQA